MFTKKPAAKVQPKAPVRELTTEQLDKVNGGSSSSGSGVGKITINPS